MIDDVQRLRTQFRDILRQGTPRRSAWQAVVEAALTALGGEASLSSIYALVADARPTRNQFWREKIRQVAQQHCVRKSRGRYAMSTISDP